MFVTIHGSKRFCQKKNRFTKICCILLQEKKRIRIDFEKDSPGKHKSPDGWNRYFGSRIDKAADQLDQNSSHGIQAFYRNPFPHTVGIITAGGKIGTRQTVPG